MTTSKALVLVLGFGCEAFFYGCYTILFAVSIYLMFHNPRRGNGVNKPIFIISGFLYLSCSTHFALEFSHFYRVLVTTGVNGFANETNALIGADLLISVTDFIGELILIYRCWVLWSRNYWVIILPSLLSTASIVCVSVVLHLLLRINPNSPIAPHSLVPLGLAAFALPLGTNVIVTSLIAGRIWYLTPRKARMGSAQFPSGTGRAAIDIVVESGMLYLVVQLIFVILFAIGHPAQGVVGVIAVQIYGIAPTLILIRVGLGISNMQSGPIHSGPPSSMAQPTTSTQVRINTISFMESRRLPAEMPVSETKEDQGSASRSMESVTTVTV